MENRLSVAEAAGLLGASEQFIRVGLQRKELPIGYAVKTSGCWTYVITRQLFEKATGIKITKECKSCGCLMDISHEEDICECCQDDLNERR